ncbi:hypothetical protein RSSM_05106 [Rhodopirellula sallentina SM41]|uniref:Uncharacterized protein n=1 Tax=Rhodopirellula sallentina SM41 TaxID=1263870 RepID=M5TWD8_9BACT|nr:hypothetical protein RSSM_05106 [Rhodopirellula sallentina SM41]
MLAIPAAGIGHAGFLNALAKPVDARARSSFCKIQPPRENRIENQKTPN